MGAAGEPVGTVALKKESVSDAHLGPWLAALLVPPAHRGEGVGRSLLAVLDDEARRLGYERIYMSAGGEETDVSTADIEARGWRTFDQAQTLKGTVMVYVLELR